MGDCHVVGEINFTVERTRAASEDKLFGLGLLMRRFRMMPSAFLSNREDDNCYGRYILIMIQPLLRLKSAPIVSQILE